MFNYSEIKIKDFSGGMTDRYVDGTGTTSEKISNLNITKFGTLRIREGYRWYLEANTTAYAPSTGKAYMGMLSLPESENIIISQNQNFYVVTDEEEYKFNAISDVSVNSSALITTVDTPVISLSLQDSYTSDALSQTSLLNGKIALDSDGYSAAVVNSNVYIKTGDGEYKTNGVDNNFYVKSKQTDGVDSEDDDIYTITLSSELIEGVAGSAMNLSSSGVNVIHGDQIVDATVATDAGKITVESTSAFVVGDSINITNSANTLIKTDGTDGIFYITAVDTANSTITVSKVASRLIDSISNIDGFATGKVVVSNAKNFTTDHMDTVTSIGNADEGRVVVNDATEFGVIDDAGEFTPNIGQELNITNSTNSAARSHDSSSLVDLLGEPIEGASTTDLRFYIHSVNTTTNEIGIAQTASAVPLDLLDASGPITAIIAVGDKIYKKNSIAGTGVASNVDAVNVTNEDNDAIRSIGGSTTFYVVDKDIGANTITLSDDEDGVGDTLSAFAIDDKIYPITDPATINVSNGNVLIGSAVDLTAIPAILKDNDNIYSQGGAVQRSNAYGYMIEDEDVIVLSQEHTMSNGQEIFFDQVDGKDIGVSENQGYFFRAVSGSSVAGTIHTSQVGAEHESEGVNLVPLSPVNYHGGVLMYKKAATIEVLPPAGKQESLLKSSTLGNNQHVCFAEWQDQLLTTSEAISLKDLSRPGRIYYGSAPIIVKQTTDTTITANNHGLSDNDPVEYLCIYGTSVLTDNQTYYVTEKTDDTFKLKATLDGGSLTIAFDNEINQFTPTTKIWKSHSLGLPKPCVHTDGTIVDTNMSVATGTGTGKTYKYAAVYKYIYNSNGVEYTTYGPVRDINGSGVAYKYITENAINAIYGSIITDVDDGSTLASGIIGVDSESGFTVDDEIKITSNGETALRNEGTSLFVIATASGTITVSATKGGSALDLTDPSWGIINGDEIYPKASVAVTLPCLKVPLGGVYYGAQWDYDRIVIELYRTKENGSTYYYVDEIANDKTDADGKVTINDDRSDDAISAEKSLYTTGGGADFHPAPPCKYLLNSRDTAYFCNVTEETESHSGSKMFTYQHPARVYQAIPGISGSIGNVSYVDLDDDIVGIGEISGLPIVFTDTYIYRLEGRIDMLGSGDLRARVIDESVGCSAHRSIVKTPRGLFWAGKHGFYQTDGYKVINITENLDDSFRSITATNSVRKLINGTYDEKEGRIFWGACTGANLTEPDIVWVYWLRSGGFTTIEGGDIDASSLLVRDADLYRGDKYGSILRHSHYYAHDSKKIVDPVKGPASVYTWKPIPILFDYKSNAMSFGVPSRRKWVNETTISIETSGNLCVLPGSANDAGMSSSIMKDIVRKSSWTWYDPDFVWGSSDLVWNAPDIVTAVRRFPRKEQRCRRKQVKLSSGKYTKYISDDWSKTYVTDDEDDDTSRVKAVTNKWPSDLSEAEICFPCTLNTTSGKYEYDKDGDDVKCLRIEERTSDTEIKFFPLSFTGYEESSAGQYLQVDDNSYNGYISVPEIWKYDNTSESKETDSVSGVTATERETGIIGLTKDYTISIWVKADFSKDGGEYGYYNDGLDLFNIYPAEMANAFKLYVHNQDLLIGQYRYNGSIGWTSGDSYFTIDSFDDDNAVAYNSKLVGNGKVWNHIVLTHKGTDRQTDRRWFGASKSDSQLTILGTIDDTKTGHNVNSGIIGVEDTTVFTVGDVLNIVNSTKGVTKIHTDDIGEASRVRSHQFFVVEISPTDTGNSTITLSKTYREPQNYLDYSPYSVGTSGSTGICRTVIAEHLKIGDHICFVKWDDIDDLNGKYEFMDEIHSQGRIVHSGTDLSIGKLKMSQFGNQGDIVAGEELRIKTYFHPSGTDSYRTNGSSPKLFVTGVSYVEDYVIVEDINGSSDLSGWSIRTEPDNSGPFYEDYIDRFTKISDFYIIGKGYDNNPEITVSKTSDGPAFDLRGMYDEFDDSYEAVMSSDTRAKIFFTSDVSSTGLSKTPLSGSNLVSGVSNSSFHVTSGDLIYTDNSAHEPGTRQPVGGLYSGETTPGWTVYINGEYKTYGRDVVQTDWAKNIPEYYEWIQYEPENNKDILSFMGDAAYASSAKQGPPGTAINNISIFNSHKTQDDITAMYNSGIERNFTGSDCKVYLSFDELDDGVIEDEQIFKNTGSDTTIIARMKQGETGVGLSKNFSIESTKINWSIKKHQLDQDIEIKEIDIKFGVMDNVEGRYEKEVEKSNS